MQVRNETEIQLMKILFKTSKKKTTKNITSKRGYPFGAEKKLYSQLRSFFKPLTDYVNKYIDENMEPLLRGDSAGIRFDCVTEDSLINTVYHLDAITGKSFRNMVYEMEDWLSVYMPDIAELPADSNNNVILTSLSNVANDAKKYGDKEFEKAINKGINVNPPVASLWWNDMKKSWAEDNYTLIVSNAKNYVSKINTLVEQAIVNGKSPKILKDEIKKATQGLSDKHCKLLARDQMGKLNGQITQNQMQELGLDLYVWSTAYDDRVRDSHALMEGLLCRWDDASVCSYDNGKTWVDRPSGAVQLHPGQDIQCRCVALSFFPELQAEVEGVPMNEVISQDLIENNAFQLEILDENFVETGWKIDDSKRLQPKECEAISGLYKMATEVRSEFSAYTQNMVKDFDFDCVISNRDELKSKERIEEKLKTDQMLADLKGIDKNKYFNSKTNKYNCRNILDVDGNTIIVNDVSEVQQVLKKYAGDSSVVRIKNNFANPSPVMYRDINMNIKLSNGIIVETQINTSANIVAKNYGHSLYEIYRSISNDLDYKPLANKMAQAQEKLYKLSNQLSFNGDFPKVQRKIQECTYKPYEKILKEELKDAIPEYKKAKEMGLFDEKTVKHFEELCEKIALQI